MRTHAHGTGVHMRLSETAAAGAGTFRGDRVRPRFQLVRQRRKLRRIPARPVGERLPEQPVGEPGVSRQERTVEVRADGSADPRSLVAALTVVAEAGDHAAERLGPRVEARTAHMVLEPGEGATHTRLELALEEDVADHAPLAGRALERQEAGAWHLLAVKAAVAAAEQLVTATDREERSAALEHGRAQRLGLRGEILRDEQLLPVLAAAHVIEVVVARDDRIVHPERRDVELVPSKRCAPSEHRDVATVGIDVEVIRIEMADADRRHALRSQYFFARPRSATMRCSPSIAV